MAKGKRPTLKFNSSGFVQLYKSELIKTTNEIMKSFEKDVKMRLNKAKNDIEREESIEIGKNIISAKVTAYAQAIMESYGTGSKMDTSNPFLDDYRGSDLWNPARKGIAISGRPKGKYINILGEEKISSGSMEGKNLEQISPLFQPKTPTMAIQQAQEWLKSNTGYFEYELNLFRQKVFSNINQFFIYN